MSAAHAFAVPFASLGRQGRPRVTRVRTVGEDLDEQRLAQAFRDRREGSLDAAYARHAPAILGFLSRAVRDRGSAEDVLQEVFTDAWRRADRFDPERASLATWLMVIARSRAVDHLRRRVPEPRDTSIPGALDEPEDPGASTDALIGQWRFAALVSTLSDDEARVLRMRFHLGLSQSEIAEQTGMPIGTVKTRMNRALTRLRTLLDEEAGA